MSILTPVTLAVTSVLYCLHGLNPALNTVLNSVIGIIWALAFGLLSWWSSGTLTMSCNKDKWNSDLGTSVCRLYKSLFSFTLLTFLATLVALLLDVLVQRKISKRGNFQQLQTFDQDGKQQGFAEHNIHQETLSFVTGRSPSNSDEAGYALPEEQFTYDDSTYSNIALPAKYSSSSSMVA